MSSLQCSSLLIGSVRVFQDPGNIPDAVPTGYTPQILSNNQAIAQDPQPNYIGVDALSVASDSEVEGESIHNSDMESGAWSANETAATPDCF